MNKLQTLTDKEIAGVNGGIGVLGVMSLGLLGAASFSASFVILQFLRSKFRTDRNMICNKESHKKILSTIASANTTEAEKAA